MRLFSLNPNLQELTFALFCNKQDKTATTFLNGYWADVNFGSRFWTFQNKKATLENKQNFEAELVSILQRFKSAKKIESYTYEILTTNNSLKFKIEVISNNQIINLENV